MTVDILVIGGGLSGMAAAWAAHKAGRSVLVLEARDRVGGRTYTRDTQSGGRSDLGGAWINEHTQPNIAALAREAGLTVIPQSIRGTAVVERAAGALQEYEDHGTFELEDGMPAADRADEQRVIGLLDELSALVDVEAPWTCPRADEFDALSFRAWLVSVGARPATQDGMASFVRLLLAVELSDVSFLYMLHYLVCGGGYHSLASNDARGGQFQRLRDGSMSVSEYIAAQLPPGSVRLSTPVQAVAQDLGPGGPGGSGACTVVARGGGVFAAAAVVCTLPSPLYATVAWSPPLPAAKRSYAQRAFLGACTKVVLVYARPWWREAGYSGLAMSLAGPVVQTMDTSDGVWRPHDGDGPHEDDRDAPRQHSLSCFPMAAFALALAALPPDERRRRVTQHVARLFPRHAADALAPVQVFEQQWLDEEFSAGAPVPVLGCGGLTAVGRAARTPHGRVFFAGTEMALRWKGYMDGAVSAGQQAVADALQAVGI